MEDGTRQFVAVLRSVQLGQRTPPFRFVIHVGEAMNGLVDASEFSHRLGQPGWAVIDPERSHDRRRLDQAEFERAGQPKEIVPVLLDEIDI